MIYSASRRTDLPGGHADWLAARLGRARKLDAAVYWTKNPAPLIRHAGLARALARWPAVVQLTVTGLAGTVWEPGAPPLAAWREELRELGRRLPPGAVIWRFDPIILPGDADAAAAERELVARFAGIHEALAGVIGAPAGVTTSFFQPYRHAVARMRKRGLAWRAPGAAEQSALLEALAKSTGDASFRFALCCQPNLPLPAGVAAEPAACVAAERFDRLYGTNLAPLPQDAGQRAGCQCSQSTDIGRYDMPCPHRCAYCYAGQESG